MTYLQVVNSVLRRLRENEVSSVSENSYSLLIGELVNDAKKTVENAWDWSALRTDITFNTSASDFTYSLTGAKDNSKVLDALNDTANTRVQYETPAQFRTFRKLGSASSGAPFYFTFNGFDSNSDTQIDVYPTPDGVYSLIFTVVLRPDSLSNDSDVLSVPSSPVVLGAAARAARERGETGGQSAAEYFNLAQVSLSDAIAFDAAKNPEELVFRVV